MIFDAVCREARAVSSASLAVPMSPEEWARTIDERREMWREMLGLSPLPERTPLEATVTGTLERDTYVVEKVHFQSMPHAYVAGNLYRPPVVDEPLPAVLYLCGHTKGKVNGPYQANPRWFGEHGYVALVIDPIQLGESQGAHHGTYRMERWDWYSRGYTPAGTEVWNAMRALDYLQGRDDVDGQRLGVTGLSGGGAMSWFLGAADERVKCVVPVCQTGSIEQLGCDRATDGHCDCAFWINYYRWCTPDLGALIAPRPLLIAAGSEDTLWRPYAYRDVFGRLQRQYAMLDAGEDVALAEDLAPHGYTPRLRRAIFTWFGRHLKGDSAPVTDDVTAHVEPEPNLWVFGGALPEDDEMARIDTLLVGRRTPRAPRDDPEFQPHSESRLPGLTHLLARRWGGARDEALTALRRTTFRHVPHTARPRLREALSDGTSDAVDFGTYAFDTEDGLALNVRVAIPQQARRPTPSVAFALKEDARSGFCGGGPSRPGFAGVATAGVEVRHTAATSVGPGYLWTLRRVYPLLGHTLPERQVADLLAGIALLRSQPWAGPLAVYGEGSTAVLALYAALLDGGIGELVMADPPMTHEDPATPEFLGVLRVGDLPHNLALLFPRRITFIGVMPPAYEWARQVYHDLGVGDQMRVIPDLQAWRPQGEET